MKIEIFSKKYGQIKNWGSFFTYEAKSLPFNLNELLNFETLNLVSEVSANFGSLNNYVSKVENVDLLIAPYLRKEALSSSTIEGTKTSLDKVFLSEKDKKFETPDSKEVLNYLEALNLGLEIIKSKKIDENLIKELHKILISGVRGELKDPGLFKKGINWIGGLDPKEAEFVPAHPNSINFLMENLITYLNNDEDGENIFLKIAIIHYQFETIHPFRDGNGRIGRLLIILFLSKKNILSKPLIYISGFFERYKKEYMQKLQYVREKGELKEWINFFLKALKEQSFNSIKKIEKLNNYKLEIEEKLKNKKSIKALKTVNYLFQNIFPTTNDIAKYLKVGYPTAKFVVEEFIKLKVLKQFGDEKRNKTFIAEKILEILMEN